MIIAGKRLADVHLLKVRGQPDAALDAYLVQYIHRPGRDPATGRSGVARRYELPLEGGGRLARRWNAAMDGQLRYVTYAKAPPAVQAALRQILASFRAHGDPVTGDESIYP